jgi:hypothetical protein
LRRPRQQVPVAALEPPLVSQGRLVAAAVPLLLLLLAAVGWVSGVHDLQVAPLVTLVLLLWATPFVLLAEPMSWSRLLFWATTLSMTGTCGVGMALAVTPYWHPRVFVVLQLVATAAASLLVVRRELAQRERWPVLTRPDPLLVAVTALGVLLVGLGSAQRALPAPSGMRVVVGFLWYLGITSLVAVVVLQVRRGRAPGVGVLALSSVTVLSQAFVYGAPTVYAAARHVGVVDYIRVHHRLDPSLDIYQAWAGLFSGTAYLADAVNLHDPMVLATWWATPVSAILVLGVRELALALGIGSTRAWVAAGVFGLADTLNIVYYSPQSLGLAMALGIMALGLQARRRDLWWWVRMGSLCLVISFTHQLSPYFATAAMGLLMLRRLVRPWWLPALPFVPALAWALLNRDTLGGFVSIKALGRLFDNLQPPSHPTVQGGSPALITRLAFDIPALVLFVVGVVAVVTILVKRDRFHVSLTLAALSPASLFLASDYGQEGIFRVALFALPWLGILAADLPWRFTPLRSIALATAVVLAFGANVFGQTAMDWARVIRPDSEAATRYFEHNAIDGGVCLIAGSGNATPGKITARYTEVRYVSRPDVAPIPSLAAPYDPAADIALMTRRLVTRITSDEYYVIVSDSTGAYDQRYTGQPFSRYIAFRQAMRSAPEWKLVQSGPSTDLYQLRDSYLLGQRT